MPCNVEEYKLDVVACNAQQGSRDYLQIPNSTYELTLNEEVAR